MSEETKELGWEDYVRSEVTSLLDLYLPESATGNVGIKYSHPAKSVDESGNPIEIDNSVIDGVTIQLTFEFSQNMEIIKEET